MYCRGGVGAGGGPSWLELEHRLCHAGGGLAPPPQTGGRQDDQGVPEPCRPQENSLDPPACAGHLIHSIWPDEAVAGRGSLLSRLSPPPPPLLGRASPLPFACLARPASVRPCPPPPPEQASLRTCGGLLFKNLFLAFSHSNYHRQVSFSACSGSRQRGGRREWRGQRARRIWP